MACVIYEAITLERAFNSRRRTELYTCIGDPSFMPRIDVLDEKMYVNVTENEWDDENRQLYMDNLLMAYNDANVMLKKQN